MESQPHTDHWKRDQIERIWDVFAKHDMAFDRLSMYHDEGADSEFCEMHRRALVSVLDEAGLVARDEEQRR